MEKKLTNSGPLREPADKHSIYTMYIPKCDVGTVGFTPHYSEGCAPMVPP